MATLTELGFNSRSTAGQSVTATLGSGVSAGNDVLVVCSSSGAGQIASANVTDTRGNSYTLDSTQTYGSTDGRFGTWRAHVATTLQAGDGIVFNNGGSSFKTIWAGFISVPSTDPSFDVKANTKGTSTFPSAGTTGATTQNDELAISAFVWSSLDTFTAPSGWSQPTTPVVSTSGTTTHSIAVCYKVLTATGTQTSTATLGASVNWAAVITTFKMEAEGVGITKDVVPAQINGVSQVSGALVRTTRSVAPKTTLQMGGIPFERRQHIGGVGSTSVAGIIVGAPRLVIPAQINGKSTVAGQLEDAGSTKQLLIFGDIEVGSYVTGGLEGSVFTGSSELEFDPVDENALIFVGIG